MTRAVVVAVVASVAVVAPFMDDARGRANPTVMATVCDLFCDTRDPSLARQETFPVAQRLQNNRRIGATWEGLLGKAGIPSTWTGTRTLMYNISDVPHHKRGVIRAGPTLG